MAHVSIIIQKAEIQNTIEKATIVFSYQHPPPREFRPVETGGCDLKVGKQHITGITDFTQKIDIRANTLI